LPRNVRGVLFADYVRMIRGHKGPDWSKHLAPEDMPFLSAPIEPGEWYPMAAFERLGNAILREVAQGHLEAVRQWGRFSVAQLRKAEPMLVAPGDAVETLMRFGVHRATFFDFEALSMQTLAPGHADVEIHYYMGAEAEEAASFQTMGFFEGLLDAAGATDVVARFERSSWKEDPDTLLGLRWIEPRR